MDSCVIRFFVCGKFEKKGDEPGSTSHTLHEGHFSLNVFSVFLNKYFVCIFRVDTTEWELNRRMGVQEVFIYNMCTLMQANVRAFHFSFALPLTHNISVARKCQKKKTDVKYRSTRLLIHINIFVSGIYTRVP